MGRLIIDGNQVYEIDEECMKKKDCEQRTQLEKQIGDKKDRQTNKTAAIWHYPTE